MAFIGEIQIFPGKYAPGGWYFCDGSLLSISEFPQLFQLFGTTYGGDGEKTFALPNLSGRVPVHCGAGPGLEPLSLAQAVGASTVTLSQDEFPAHSHDVMASTLPPTAPNSLALAAALTYSPIDTPPLLALNPASISASGGGNQPHPNEQPYLTLYFAICALGVYPD
jgi:microcystin-dependent protein